MKIAIPEHLTPGQALRVFAEAGIRAELSEGAYRARQPYLFPHPDDVDAAADLAASLDWDVEEDEGGLYGETFKRSRTS